MYTSKVFQKIYHKQLGQRNGQSAKQIGRRERNAHRLNALKLLVIRLRGKLIAPKAKRKKALWIDIARKVNSLHASNTYREPEEVKK